MSRLRYIPFLLLFWIMLFIVMTLSGCTLFTKAAPQIAKGVNRYCLEQQATRLLIREQVNMLIIPNSIQVHCAGDDERDSATRDPGTGALFVPPPEENFDMARNKRSYERDPDAPLTRKARLASIGAGDGDPAQNTDPEVITRADRLKSIGAGEGDPAAPDIE